MATGKGVGTQRKEEKGGRQMPGGGSLPPFCLPSLPPFCPIPPWQEDERGREEKGVEKRSRKKERGEQ